MRHTTASSIADIRKRAAYQFELEQGRLGFAVVKRLPNYRYIVYDQQTGREYTAMVLPATFDFYEYRLNRGKQRVDMLIVARHNAVVPVRVLSLEDVTSYAPLAEPRGIEREQRTRRNHEETALLVSKLLLNFESAWSELKAMPARSRQRYVERCHTYLSPKIGRPWAS